MLRNEFEEQGFVSGLRSVDEPTAEAAKKRVIALHEEHGRFPTKMKAHLVFPFAYELATSKPVLDALEEIIGPNILIFSSTFWLKKAESGLFVSWHQDGLLLGLDPVTEVTVWTALTKSIPQNGCLQVIPRSHANGVLTHDFDPEAKNLLPRGQTVAGAQPGNARHLSLSPGECSIHDTWTAHGSAPNTTDEPRIGLSVFYIPTHVRSLVPGRGATLVRGEDNYGYWEPEPRPSRDWDPVGLRLDEQAWQIHSNSSAITAM